MTKFKMDEWLKLHDDARNDGKTIVTGVNLDMDNRASSVEMEIHCSSHYSIYGPLYPDSVLGVYGNKKFVREEDGTISLVVDCDKDFKTTVKPSEDNFKNKVVIPLKKWLADFKNYQNISNKDISKHYRSIEVVGCEIDTNGFVKSVGVDVVYDAIGLKVFKKIHPEDVIRFTYGMYRDDITDSWCGTGNNDKKVLFNENLDLVFDDDNGYYITIEANHPSAF